MINKMKFLQATVLIAALTLSSCAGIYYSQSSANKTQELRQRTTTIINQAVEPYEQHASAMGDLKIDYKAAIAQEERRGKTNYPTIQMWKAVDQWVNSDFDSLWRKRSTLRTVECVELSKRADRLFEYIQNLESNKIKP